MFSLIGLWLEEAVRDYLNFISRIEVLLLSVILFVAVLSIFFGYSFFPSKISDGFLEQMRYIHRLIDGGAWFVLLSDALSVVHLLRFVLISPFLMMEEWLGPVGSIVLLDLALCPLLLAFMPSGGGWRAGVSIACRMLILALPLLVSGRTVLVAIGMGYLVSGLLFRPFSRWRILLGVLLASLSSASLFLSIAILILVRNSRRETSKFYIYKLCMIVLILLILSPSILAKFNGFVSGAPGYELQAAGAPQRDVRDIDGRVLDVGVLRDDDEVVMEVQPVTGGYLAGVERLLMRSTAVQSYLEGRYVRLALYLGLWGAALFYIFRSATARRWHAMVLVLAILSTGIFVEGLSLWPLLFPLVWAYTGDVCDERGRGTAWRRVEVELQA